MKTFTVSFQTNQEDFDNLLSIVHEYYVKYRFESKTDPDKTENELAWCLQHGDYVKKHILDKLINGKQSK